MVETWFFDLSVTTHVNKIANFIIRPRLPGFKMCYIFSYIFLKSLPSNGCLWLLPYIRCPPLGERRVIGTNIHRKDEQDVSERKKGSGRVEGFRGLQFTGGGRRVKAVDSLWLSNPLIPGLWSGIGGAEEGADPSLCPLSVKASR